MKLLVEYQLNFLCSMIEESDIFMNRGLLFVGQSVDLAVVRDGWERIYGITLTDDSKDGTRS